MHFSSSSPSSSSFGPYKYPSTNFHVFQSRSTANVVMSLYPLWSHELPGIVVPEQHLLRRIELPSALVQQWIENEDEHLGGLLFPRGPFDMASQEPFVQVLKSGAMCRRGRRTQSSLFNEVRDLHGGHALSLLEDDSAHITRSIPRPKLSVESTPEEPHLKVDITLFVFRRDLGSSAELNAFDPRRQSWHPLSYHIWTDIYHNFAPTMQEECAALSNPTLPSDACALFRRVMRTHYDDCGILFGKIWWDFGLGAMVGDRVNLRSFMRGMLTDMFMAYHAIPAPPPVRTLFSPRTYDPGHRMCAHCLVLVVGQRGRMMRCPCGQVYYCGVECQRAHWKVHRTVCAEHAKKRNGGVKK